MNDDEPTIPTMITVGNIRFHTGVKVSTVQGAIDRIVARIEEMNKEIQSLHDTIKIMPDMRARIKELEEDVADTIERMAKEIAWREEQQSHHEEIRSTHLARALEAEARLAKKKTNE
jgi:predicted RNA-binding protein with EMAP domain